MTYPHYFSNNIWQQNKTGMPYIGRDVSNYVSIEPKHFSIVINVYLAILDSVHKTLLFYLRPHSRSPKYIMVLISQLYIIVRLKANM